MSQSQRKSQRGKKLEEVVWDLRNELGELRNESEKKNEEMRNIKNQIEIMEVEWKKDREKCKKYLEGWEMEYRTRQQVVEELDKNEEEKKRLAMEIQMLVSRWNIYETRIVEKDLMISTEIRKNIEVKQRMEELEMKMLCWESAKEEEEKKLGNRQNLFPENMDKVHTHKNVVSNNNPVNQNRIQEVEIEMVTNQVSLRKSKNVENEKTRDAGNRKFLLVGDVNTKIAREFCKEEGFGAWSIPGTDIDNLESRIRNSKKAETESPKEIVIYVGRRDVSRNDKCETITMNLTKLFKTTKEKYGEDVKINMCGWSKNIGRYLNEKIAKVCTEENVNMIKINPRWEMEVDEDRNGMTSKWLVAIGTAIRKSMKEGQQKQSGTVFRTSMQWRRTK